MLSVTPDRIALCPSRGADPNILVILGVTILLCNNPMTLLNFRAPDKRGIENNSKIIFLISQ